MIPKVYVSIINRLFQKTKDRKLSWFKSASKGSFIIGFTNYALEISNYYGSMNYQPHISIKIHNVDGEVIDEFEILDSEDEYEQAVELYSNARRSALKINEAIKEINNELSLDKPSGHIPSNLKTADDDKDNDDDLPF